MVVADRPASEINILRAGQDILKIVDSAPDKEFDPGDLVIEISVHHSRYSARAALLHLIESGKLKLTANWLVTSANVRS
jgi:hypothetical protein